MEKQIFETVCNKNKYYVDKYVVEASALRKEFFDKKSGIRTVALDNLEFQVPKGRLTAVIGPDGAGKTTLMRLIAGLMAPSDGELRVLGMDIRGSEQQVQSLISYMPQKFGLYEDLSIRENMNLYADLHGIPMDERGPRFKKLLKMTGLEPFTERLAGKLSGGMKQKLGVACTLVRAPKLLMLDEPTVGVDPLSRRELWVIIKQLVAEEGLSILVNTAYMDEAELCDLVYVLDKGRVLAKGTPEDLRNISKGLTYQTQVNTNNKINTVNNGNSNVNDMNKQYDGVPTRIIQALLLDDSEHIIDAVPDGEYVRYVQSSGTPADYISNKLGLITKPVPSTLEDSFMLLLHQAQSGEAGLLTPAQAQVNTCSGNADSDHNAAQVNHNVVGISYTREKASNNENNEKTVEAAASTANAYYKKLSLNEHYGPEDSVDIEVRDLLKTFGSFIAVNKTSFQVHKGEIFGLLGPNGAGKTTTFRMLCGLLKMTDGFLSVAGVDLRTARTQARMNIGYVAQKFSLYTNLTVQENLEFFGGAYGLKGDALKERIPEIMEELQLTGQENMMAGALPGGYKQRLSMAAALIHKPRILFLDEPTSGIDPLARRSFWRQITDLAAKGTTIIVTTHFMEEAEYCDRMMIQDRGRLLAIGTPADIKRANGGIDLSMNEVFIRIIEENRRKGGE